MNSISVAELPEKRKKQIKKQTKKKTKKTTKTNTVAITFFLSVYAFGVRFKIVA